MKAKPLPPLEFLQECFEIDLSCPSGLRWKIRPRHHFPSEYSFIQFSKQFAGKPAGHKDHYYLVEIQRKTYMCHRIIYALYHKTVDFTHLQIDHKNRNPYDNEPENLRLCNQFLNELNKKENITNTSGFKNISWDSEKKKWRVVFTLFGKERRIGRFKLIEDAAEARDSFLLSNIEEFPFLYIPDYLI